MKPRKAQAPLEGLMGTLIDIILASIVAVAFVVVASQRGSGEDLEKKMLTTELAMLTTLSEAAPGQIVIIFTPPKVELAQYSFVWNEETLGVDSKKYPNEKKRVFLWDKSLFKSNIQLKKKPSQIVFTNDRVKLNITNSSLELKNLLVCPTTTYKPRTLMIDSGHGEEDDTGLIVNGFSESAECCQLAEALAASLDGFEILYSRPFAEYDQINIIRCSGTTRVSEEEVAEKLNRADLLVSLHVGNYTGSNSYVKAFVAVNDNYSIAYSYACRILNQLVLQLDELIDGIIVMPYDPNEDATGQYSILQSTDKPAFVLELGNIQSSKINELFENKAKMATAIAHALKNE